MSDAPQGPDWYQASDGKWYPPTAPTATAAPAAPGGQGTIEVKATFMVLAFVLFLFKPKGTIDGQPVDLTWGDPGTSFPVAPGRHTVEVWCPYFFVMPMGKNGTQVDVAPGQTVKVHWKCPWLVFLKGNISAA